MKFRIMLLTKDILTGAVESADYLRVGSSGKPNEFDNGFEAVMFAYLMGLQPGTFEVFGKTDSMEFYCEVYYNQEQDCWTVIEE